MQKYLTPFLCRRPGWVVAVFCAFFVVALSQLPNLKWNPTPYLLAKDHPSRQSVTKMREEYTGAGGKIVVVLESKTSVFTPQTLQRIQRLTQAFEAITLITLADEQKLRELARFLPAHYLQEWNSFLNGTLNKDDWVDLESLRFQLELEGLLTDKAKLLFANLAKRLQPIAKVTSLANTDNIVSRNGELVVGPIFTTIPVNLVETQQIRDAVQGNALFKNILISDDGRRTSLILELAVADDATEEQSLVYDRIKEIIQNEIPGPEAYYIGGLPVLTAAISTTMQLDAQRLFPAVLILIMACLWVTFRMAGGVWIPLMVVIFSVATTLAMEAAFEIPVNIITTALPIFIISIGVADGIHIFSEFRDHLIRGERKTEAIQGVMKNLTRPVVMTSLTTACAFWSLSITKIIQIKYFGLFVALGTLIAMVCSLVLSPCLLLFLGTKGGQKPTRIALRDSQFSTLLERSSSWAMEHPLTVWGATLLIVAIAAYGATKVSVDNDFTKYLPRDDDVVVSTEYLNNNTAGSLPLNLLVKFKGNEQEPFKSPNNLLALAKLTAFLERHPLVGKTLSLDHLLERINFVLHDNNPSYNRIPAEVEKIPKGNPFSGRSGFVEIPGKQFVSQLLLLYTNAGGNVLSDVIDSEYSQANVSVILKTNSTRAISALVSDLRKFEKENLPPDLDVLLSGSANVNLASTSEIVSGFVASLFISFALVFMLLLYIFRSFLTGCLAMLPLLATVLVNFGVMGYLRVPLDVGTAIVSSIVIGVGVDYSIHYLSRLKRQRDDNKTLEEAVQITARVSGKAIVSNALTVGIGFAALLVSVFTPLRTLGWMITMTMCISALTTILLLPASLILLQKGQGVIEKSDYYRISDSKTL